LHHNQLIFESQVNSELVLETLLNISISTVSISVLSTFSSSKHLKIYAINSASFLQLARKKNHDLFIIFMRNINKALKITSFVDFVMLLLFEYHNFLNVFSCKLMNILPEQHFYDHKIQLQKSKTSIFESLYNMSQDELQILKKYLKNNLIKDFIQVSSFFVISSILFVKKSSEELKFCVNYWSLNVMTVKNQYSLSLI